MSIFDFRAMREAAALRARRGAAQREFRPRCAMREARAGVRAPRCARDHRAILRRCCRDVDIVFFTDVIFRFFDALMPC